MPCVWFAFATTSWNSTRIRFVPILPLLKNRFRSTQLESMLTAVVKDSPSILLPYNISAIDKVRSCLPLTFHCFIRMYTFVRVYLVRSLACMLLRKWRPIGVNEIESTEPSNDDYGNKFTFTMMHFKLIILWPFQAILVSFLLVNECALSGWIVHRPIYAHSCLTSYALIYTWT